MRRAVSIMGLICAVVLLGSCASLLEPAGDAARGGEAADEAASGDEGPRRIGVDFYDREDDMTAGSADTRAYRMRPMEAAVRKLPRELRKGMEEAPAGHLEELVRHLTARTPDPFLQVKLIHDWICDNIAYDTQGFFSGNIPRTAYQHVLEERRAVCSGYANLFATMARSAGFEVRSISGAAKGYGYTLFSREEFESNHAWNAVYIKGEWYLLDCTWDAGHVNGRRYVKEYSTGYLFIRPEGMIYSHFPEDEQWQLLDPAVTYAQYSRLPQLMGEFFLYLEPKERLGALPARSGIATVAFDKRRPATIISSVVSESGRKIPRADFVENSSGRARLTFALPKPGRYMARLFAREEGEDYRYLGRLPIEAAAGSSIRLPTVYTPFLEKGFRLEQPQEKYLPRGESSNVVLYAPGWRRAHITGGGERHPMRRSAGDRFVLEDFSTTADSVTIYGSARSSGSSEGALVLYVR